MIKIDNMLKKLQYLKQLLIILWTFFDLLKEKSSDTNLVDDKFIPDNAIVKKNANIDNIIPNVPNKELFILLDKNMLNNTAIKRKNKVEMVRIKPFFINVFIFFIKSSTYINNKNICELK